MKSNAQHSKIFSIITSVIIVLFVLCQASFAKDGVNDKSLKSYKLPSNLKKHLQDKHKDKDNKDEIEEVSSTLQETPHGPRGKLHLRGHIKPKNVEATSGDKHEHARAIAKAFLNEESELLGLPDLAELRESKIETVTGHDGEYTHVYYERYIGDVLFGSGMIHATIGPDDSVRFFFASLLPAPSETYSAVTQTTITEDDARKIVKKDVKAHGSDPNSMNVLTISKFASPNAPYVFWGVDVAVRNKTGRWEYLIDAFTGDVLRKTDKMIED